MKFIKKIVNKIKFIINTKFIYYYKINKLKYNKKLGINTSKRNDRIIVSLTSIQSRFNKLHLCIESIMRQTVKADKIILYLGENVKGVELPNKLLELKDRGLTIEYREDKKLKPHTKYYYAMQEYPNDIIITCDDDIIYDKNLIKNLYNSYKKYPNVVSAMRVHKIKFDSNDKIENYRNWLWEYNKQDALIPNNYLLATGVGGVLYPPNCLCKETFNIEKINELSLNADDLWLKIMEIQSDTKVVKATSKNFYLQIIRDTQQIALSKDNVIKCKNDKIMKKLIEYYNISKEKIYQEEGENGKNKKNI